MNQDEKLNEGWLSKKWLTSILCLAYGALKTWLISELTTADVTLILGIAAIYGGANVANKSIILGKSKITEAKNGSSFE